MENLINALKDLYLIVSGDVVLGTAGIGVLGLTLKKVVELFTTQSKANDWFDSLNTSFSKLLDNLTLPICAVLENVGIGITKVMANKIGKSIWNNTIEPILIWVVEGVFGLVIILFNWLVTLPGKLLKAFVLGLRSDNQEFTSLK